MVYKCNGDVRRTPFAYEFVAEKTGTRPRLVCARDIRKRQNDQSHKFSTHTNKSPGIHTLNQQKGISKLCHLDARFVLSCIRHEIEAQAMG